MLPTNTVTLAVYLGVLPTIWYLWKKAYSLYTSPLLHLPGPHSPNKFYGHVRQMCSPTSGPITLQWLEDYGPTICTSWLFQLPSLWTADPTALTRILTSSKYIKPWEARMSAAQVIGNSVLIMEGEAHRNQRRILNPAFSPGQIRELTACMVHKALQLRKYWEAQLNGMDDWVTLNAADGLKKVTLDIIGLAGFGYDLEALSLDGKPNELCEAFGHIFGTAPPVSILRLFMAFVPQLDFFPDERTIKINEAMETMRRIGLQLIREKREAILAESSGKGSGSVGKHDVEGRDLLSLLIKANMASDLPDEQRLSEEEVLSQIPTFLIAGHETTSSSVSWCLFALTQAPAALATLRAELLAVPTDAPTMDELAALPYLDQVVRETMRLHTPMTFTLRVPTEDDVIPVGTPYTDRRGVVRHEIHIMKGNRIVIPVLALHRSKAVWGDDALEFRPERWQNPPEGLAASIPGVWSNQLAFLGGPRACIGYRFALTEMKAILFTIVRGFEFELAVPAEEIVPVGLMTRRTAVKSEAKKGAQLPLRMRPYRRT
ncbi:cytochrome P450 [Epithele typhae]|uniref:cytochrome P450 n=1 Tax=Epithele typhae TaxID=378194 RepID=UPI002008D91A|nr:cytochrome P450 [Epithele typhae]KAH9920872.1 cytochrome P450 [Epithele typhae]